MLIFFLDMSELKQLHIRVCGVWGFATSTIYHTNLYKEILHWRAELRDAEYLLTPKREVTPSALSNRPLDSDISHFPKKCKDNLYFFISECSKVNSVNSVKLEPIFILPEDRKNNNSIERKNKKEITAIIEQELEKLEVEDIDLGIILYKIPWMLHIHEY